MDERISVSRRISAPADRIFEIIADPQGQISIDGSGMLVRTESTGPLQKVNDTFVMDMDGTPLGERSFGKYQVLNTVTKISPDAELEWTVGGIDMPPIGHVYGYTLTPIGDQETDVTTYCDWSGVTDEWRDKVVFPTVPLEMLSQSLENLEKAVTKG